MNADLLVFGTGQGISVPCRKLKCRFFANCTNVGDNPAVSCLLTGKRLGEDADIFLQQGTKSGHPNLCH